MKLFWFIVSCVIVVVSTDVLTDYKRSISITTYHLHCANGMTVINGQTGSVENALEYVIEKIVDNPNFSLEYLNNMFAVPDFILDRSWTNLEEIQDALRSQIRDHTQVTFPDIPDPNFASYHLVDLAEQRRSVTLGVLKRMWNRLIVSNLPGVRSTCRFIAIYLSAKNYTHLWFSRNVVISGGSCRIESTRGTREFRKVWSQWHEVTTGGMIPLKLEPLR
ncbi:uncharacterized protein LOC126845134, partial [Adelges cooleyi]|uniref:uncharacterized protein LOC126845134 n=1 Tax=Adelges cooleyi TaxID=133065 RepID=UPI00217F898C